MRLLLVAIYFNRATRADWNDRHAFNSEERLKEVSLDRATDDGWSVYRAEKSQPWPGEASAEISLIWIGHPGRGELRVLNGSPVAAIRPNLEATSRVTGSPYSLNENSGIAFKGCEPIGMGFFVEDAVARSLKMEDPTSAYVIFPYLSGDDLNSTKKNFDYWTFSLFYDIIYSWTEKVRSGFRVGHCRIPGPWLSEQFKAECT